jgi:putative aldouronate transport system substrate-binding protein
MARQARDARPPFAEPAPTRRDFIALLGGGAAAALGGPALEGCSRRAGARGWASNAHEAEALLPRYKPIDLLQPDFPGRGPIPNGYLRYPAQLTRAIAEKPSRSGRVIRTMSPAWGPAPPGLGHNSFLDAINGELGVSINPSIQDGATYGDKLGAMLGARDVPDILVTPSWEIDRIPRFSQAAKALFADLSEFLRGDAVDEYPMLATLPSLAWQYSIWSGRLCAVPYPTDGPFPWALFYRKDLTDRAGVEPPATIDDLYVFGKRMTDPVRGVWAFGGVFNMLQMLFKCPGSKGGWRRKPGGGLEFKLEMPEFRQAVEFTARLFREGLVHPDVAASKGADTKQLFNAGRIVMSEDGMGAWRAMQSEQAKVTPGYDMQPLPIFSAVGGDPIAWGSGAPIFYSFVKKGLGRDRTREILRVLNWCAAPFGSKEYELNRMGVEGKHFTRTADGSPMPTELGRKEVAVPGQYELLGGRAPAVVGTADVPKFVEDLFAYLQSTIRFLEPDLFEGIKVEFPAAMSRGITPAEDKLNDVIRGRRPIGDLDEIIAEWRASGGDEGREFLEETLAANGR